MLLECKLELAGVKSRYREVADRWGLDEGERAAVERASGAAQAETRLRHIVDVDRAASTLLGDLAMVGAWVRTPNPGLDGHSPLAAIAGSAGALREIRAMLRRELLDAGFDL